MFNREEDDDIEFIILVHIAKMLCNVFVSIIYVVWCLHLPKMDSVGINYDTTI